MSKIDIVKLILWARAKIKDELDDDGHYTAAETIELLGLLCRKLEDEPELVEYKAVLHWVGGGLLHVAKKMGEDGV